MNEGKKFEDDFRKSIPEGAYYLRIKDSAMSWGQNENTRFTPKNPYDAILFCNNILFVLELKSTQGTSLPYDKIKPQQIGELLKANQTDGILAGFIINFRKTDRTYFLNIEDFARFTGESKKKSINEADLVSYGAVEIKAEKKRTRSRYNIVEFVNLVSA